MWTIECTPFHQYLSKGPGDSHERHAGGDLGTVRKQSQPVAPTLVQAYHDGSRTRSESERTIPVRTTTLNDIYKRHERRDDHLDGPVLTDRRGLPIKPDRASRRSSDMVDVAGLDDRLTFHSLRHITGASRVSEGVPLKVVQAILGHSAQRVADRYGCLAPETLDAAMDEVFGQ